ncbi:hypothetical protein SB48_HM08orf04985 [Heyndrickxia coagulans]|uniref:Uncharacterized protein n=1 Tax=Heyndrickxia coagulans TaxID=1398 RepID=A0AAN0T8R8_HEYCO|nr:hypothetical protein SB48_HM08orf04985 [Heyndrickxia coagulans]
MIFLFKGKILHNVKSTRKSSKYKEMNSSLTIFHREEVLLNF